MLESEIMQYLDSEIESITFDESGATGNIFDNALPSSPDKAVMIENTGGLAQDMRRTSYQDVNYRILVRGTQDPRVARDLAVEISDTIGTFGEGSFVENGVYIVKCQTMQPKPVNIGQDENNRHRFSINLDLRIKKESDQ